jgi:hypothetical protein
LPLKKGMSSRVLGPVGRKTATVGLGATGRYGSRAGRAGYGFSYAPWTANDSASSGLSLYEGHPLGRGRPPVHRYGWADRERLGRRVPGLRRPGRGGPGRPRPVPAQELDRDGGPPASVTRCSSGPSRSGARHCSHYAEPSNSYNTVRESTMSGSREISLPMVAASLIHPSRMTG